MTTAAHRIHTRMLVTSKECDTFVYSMSRVPRPGAATPGEAVPESKSRGVFHSAFALVLELFIDAMIRVTGRRIRKEEAPWLRCYLGKPGVIGTGVYSCRPQPACSSLRVCTGSDPATGAATFVAVTDLELSAIFGLDGNSPLSG